MAPKARQAKGKARLNSYDKLLNEDVKEKEEKLEIFIPNGPRLGNKVIEAKQVAKAFGDKLLFDDLNFMLPPNGIVGIIGPTVPVRPRFSALSWDWKRQTRASSR